MVIENSNTPDERKSDYKPLVLVVDDDEIHQKLLLLLADSLGITARIAGSCAEAIEELKVSSFDLILMDYRMPEVDGCICTKRIRTMSEHAVGSHDRVPIIGVTAHIQPESKHICIQAGMDDYLPKPFTLEELKEKIEYWLSKESDPVSNPRSELSK